MSANTFMIIGGAVTVIVFAIWIAVHYAESKGRSDAEKETEKRNNEKLRKQANVIAERRSRNDTAKRLRDGSI